MNVRGSTYNSAKHAPTAIEGVPDLRLRHAPGWAATAVIAVLATRCGSPTKPGPVVELAISSVAPSAGPASGGTELTIRGAAFATGAAISVGGRPATDVAVRGADTIAARTPASTDRRAGGRCRHAEWPHCRAYRRIQVRARRSEHRAGHQINRRAGQAPEATPDVCGLRRNHSNYARRRGRGVAGGAACISMAADL